MPSPVDRMIASDGPATAALRTPGSARGARIVLAITSTILAIIAGLIFCQWLMSCKAPCDQSVTLADRLAGHHCFHRQFLGYRARLEKWEDPVPADVDDRVWYGVLECGQ